MAEQEHHAILGPWIFTPSGTQPGVQGGLIQLGDVVATPFAIRALGAHVDARGAVHIAIHARPIGTDFKFHWMAPRLSSQRYHFSPKSRRLIFAMRPSG